MPVSGVRVQLESNLFWNPFVRKTCWYAVAPGFTWKNREPGVDVTSGRPLEIARNGADVQRRIDLTQDSAGTRERYLAAINSDREIDHASLDTHVQEILYIRRNGS